MIVGVMPTDIPVITTRLSNSKHLAMADNDFAEQPAGTIPAGMVVAEGDEEVKDTSSLSPSSETAGEGSAEEVSVEEPTAEEESETEPTVAKAAAPKVDEAEASSDENPDNSPANSTESEGVTESEEDYNDNDERLPENRFTFKVYWIWFAFWALALTGGFFSYYINTHQDIMASRMGSDANEEINLLLMPREKWDKSVDMIAKPSSYMAERVVVMQTDTDSCQTMKACVQLLNNIKRKEGMHNYNFFLATDGCIYEALGWQKPSPLYSDVRTMVVAFIGSYENTSPSAMQLSQLQSLLEVSEELKYLASTYTIVGRRVNEAPSKLFAYLSAFERWDKHRSDTDDQYADVELEPFPFFDY